MQTTHCQTFNLVQLLNQIKEDADILALKESIKLKLQFDKPEVEISVDPQLVSSAIENIVSNAIKYSSEGSRVDVNLACSEEGVNIFVRDQGKGVPEQDIEQIFEPFYRVSEARDRVTGGTGLGLAIAKRAILAHNGRISAKNTETGFEVRIELPFGEIDNPDTDN